MNVQYVLLDIHDVSIRVHMQCNLK